MGFREFKSSCRSIGLTFGIIFIEHIQKVSRARSIMWFETHLGYFSAFPASIAISVVPGTGPPGWLMVVDNWSDVLPTSRINERFLALSRRGKTFPSMKIGGRQHALERHRTWRISSGHIASPKNEEMIYPGESCTRFRGGIPPRRRGTLRPLPSSTAPPRRPRRSSSDHGRWRGT